MGSSSDVTHLDALIIGAGFGGTYQLKGLREEEYKVKLVDFASDYAGVLYWNGIQAHESIVPFLTTDFLILPYGKSGNGSNASLTVGSYETTSALWLISGIFGRIPNSTPV
jgi:cation diffusion facilitator CzcD-associated flavoprotein CzcO